MDKALTSGELELTQKIQMHFPRGIDSKIVHAWNAHGTDVLTTKLLEIFGNVPEMSKPSILEFVSTVVVPATTAKFVAKDNFKLKKDGGICSYIGDNFQSWFLAGDGKIEESIVKQTLRYAKLRKKAKDDLIIAELGGEEKSETTLSEVFYLMGEQKNGKAGVLLNNGYANIFYVRDQALVLRAVNAYWDGDGWSVSAGPIGRPDPWDADDCVFSRNPLETLAVA